MYGTSGLSEMQVLVLCILAVWQDQNRVRLFYCHNFAADSTATSFKYFLFFLSEAGSHLLWSVQAAEQSAEQYLVAT